ncbi:zinc-ribbon domain-containing protein [Actinoplanes sp. NPDC051861]|uniref:zinc-ribbon domain-containing protein n=1 Tax=Actinoplanes sp. NPDC051861 TaxID=3155170 RepID=UPI00343DEAD5
MGNTMESGAAEVGEIPLFVLFGLRTKDHMVGTRMMTCEVCGWEALQSVLRRSTKFTLFFIPLFPVKASRHFLVCGHCRAFR